MSRSKSFVFKGLCQYHETKINLVIKTQKVYVLKGYLLTQHRLYIFWKIAPYIWNQWESFLQDV